MPVPQLRRSAWSVASWASSSRPHSYPSVGVERALASCNTSFVTRPGWVAAKRIDSFAPAVLPMTVALLDPTVSSTTLMSSAADSMAAMTKWN